MCLREFINMLIQQVIHLIQLGTGFGDMFHLPVYIKNSNKQHHRKYAYHNQKQMQTGFLLPVALLICLMNGILHLRNADYTDTVTIKLCILKTIINIGIGTVNISQFKQSLRKFFQRSNVFIGCAHIGYGRKNHILEIIMLLSAIPIEACQNIGIHCIPTSFQVRSGDFLQQFFLYKLCFVSPQKFPSFIP